ncbi:MAG: vWA domain-containing protein, partial [Acidimicrobiales bacterium]
ARLPAALDLAWLVVALGGELRRAGVPVAAERCAALAVAVHRSRPVTVPELYWTARIVMLSDHDQLPAFEVVFERVFGGGSDPADTRGDTSRPAAIRPVPSPQGSQPPGVPLGAGEAAERAQPPVAGAGDARLQLLSRWASVASPDERLSSADLAALDDSERAALERLVESIRASLPMRSGRRRHRHRRGEIDLRSTLRRARRSGGDPARRDYRRASPRARRIVVLCDVSGSMEPSIRTWLGLSHAAVRAGGEAFTFATRLTRLTPVVARHPWSMDLRATAAVPDWRSGTRIAQAVASFLDSHGRRGMARGAVVVVASDGWERDDPALLGEQMARLARLAHRVVWVNPRSADPRYEPLAGGMAAALPHCDALVGVRGLHDLGEVAAALGGRGAVSPRPGRAVSSRPASRPPSGARAAGPPGT